MAPKRRVPVNRLVDALDHAESRVRELASNWSDSVPGPLRYDMLQLANQLANILQLVGKR